MMGNSQNERLQCFIHCLLLLMRIRTDSPSLRHYIYITIVCEDWELSVPLLSYMRQVYALLITIFKKVRKVEKIHGF